jgi:hypothetical protein
MTVDRKQKAEDGQPKSEDGRHTAENRRRQGNWRRKNAPADSGAKCDEQKPADKSAG